MPTAKEIALQLMDDSNPPPSDSNIFGTTLELCDAKLVLISVPWEATASYGGGTADGPEAILKASHWLDLFDLTFHRPYRVGIYMLPCDQDIADLNTKIRKQAANIIKKIEQNRVPDPKEIALVNQASDQINSYVYNKSRQLIQNNQIPAVIGGDHSCPYGLIKALSEVYPDGFGILHFDAHHDLRRAFEGFKHSHASIMYNILEDIPQVTQLTAVGIRDFCEEEWSYAKTKGKVSSYYAQSIFEREASGESYANIVQEMIQTLPNNVYVSFDIDALDPAFCPHTGTPVPGGLGFQQIIYCLHQLAASGKKIIGFDLCEVTPGDHDEYDANVGARILYKLCGALATSQFDPIE